MMGGIIGSLVVYANYINAIDVQEGGRHVRTVPGTASMFATYAVSANNVALREKILNFAIAFSSWTT